MTDPAPPFHPVVHLPDDYVVLDLTQSGHTSAVWSVGRYDEDRAIYTQDLFAGRRSLHVGIDLGGPAGTAVHAFAAGRILFVGVNPAPGDYGPTIVTEHELDGAPLWALHGHLAVASLERRSPGDAFASGDVLGHLGAEAENGGWPPHVHFQLSRVRPTTHDLPGAVDPADRARALADYPDPRIVLGPIY